MNPRAGLDALLADVVFGTSNPSRSRKRTTATDLTALLSSLPEGASCGRVRLQRDAALHDLANAAKRHTAVLAPVMKLVRLAKEGHSGVAHALTDVEKAFLEAVADRDNASSEWGRIIDGALTEVFGKAMGNTYALCECLFNDYRVLANKIQVTGASKDQALRRLMRAVVEDAVLSRTRLVDESERQLVETTELSRNTIRQGLNTLVEARVLAVADENLAMMGVKYVLPSLEFLRTLPVVAPEALLQFPHLSVPSSPAGIEDGSVFSPAVHRLFGSMGLSGGYQETFAALPECQRLLHRGQLLRVTRGTGRGALLTNPYRGRRRIPRPTPGADRTLGELHDSTGQPFQTLAGQLRVMRKQGLVFNVGPCWWRYRFHPEWLSDRLEIPDTAFMKAEVHRRERLAFEVQPVQPAAQDADPDVDVGTGEVLRDEQARTASTTPEKPAE